VPLYRFLAPKTWREWASAGVVQAFIIALYAEMYGFPLTIYMMARFFGLALWSPAPPETGATATVSAGELASPSTVRASPVQPLPSAPRPKPPIRRIAEGKLPPEFRALETQLAGMERDLSDYAAGKQALKEKVAKIDELIRRTEGIALHPDTRSSILSPMPANPVNVDKEKQAGGDMEQLRARLAALKARLPTDGL